MTDSPENSPFMCDLVSTGFTVHGKNYKAYTHFCKQLNKNNKDNDNAVDTTNL